MSISKKTIVITLVSIWIIFSVSYIAWDRWDRFKNGQMVQAYNQGKTETINAVIAQAKNDKCDAFSIYNDKEQVQLINVSCLKQPEPSSAPNVKK